MLDLLAVGARGFDVHNDGVVTVFGEDRILECGGLGGAGCTDGGVVMLWGREVLMAREAW